MEHKVLPLLRKQKGFLEELVLIAPNEIEVVAISLGEEKQYAERFNPEVYPEFVKLFTEYVEGVPIVKEFELQYARIPEFHKMAKAVTV